MQQDYKQAAEWYRKAAEQGDIEAQNSLAIMYKDGLGVTASREEAEKWYRKAIAGGSDKAVEGLARLLAAPKASAQPASAQ